ncbi:MAG: VOC family protein [Gammaproteobacteria bacterium]|nr:VOC family protein [Gammaproteobacteria bacterium]
MKPKVTVITLGVADVDAALAFYRDGLGLKVGAVKGDITYFDTGGTWLCVYPREKLAAYAGVSSDGDGFSGITLSSNVDSRKAVDEMIARAEAAGAAIVRRGEAAGWGGYTGWFRDPDGHLWEVVWNPRPFVGRDA